MKIGVISDTHVIKKMLDIEKFIEEYFYDLDMIIHAGDFNNIETVDMLRKFKSFIGVWGNNDNELVVRELKKREIIDIMGYKVGVSHGHGNNKTTIDRVYDEFDDLDVDIIIFGHSHQPIIKTKNKTLMINPGSLISKRKERWFSYALLELTENEIRAEIIFRSRII